jgi:ABC-type Mn2+/Zn2+ transport system ATPase subunit
VIGVCFHAEAEAHIVNHLSQKTLSRAVLSSICLTSRSVSGVGYLRRMGTMALAEAGRCTAGMAASSLVSSQAMSSREARRSLPSVLKADVLQVASTSGVSSSFLTGQQRVCSKSLPAKRRIGKSVRSSRISMVAAVHETVDFELGMAAPEESRRGRKKGGDQRGASSISSGVRLEGISKTYKNQQLLKNVTWEVTKGERVGLVGVNGAGKTTQLKIIVGEEEPDEGVVMKAKEDMKISFLTQEFTVVATRTVREEFLSAFEEQMEVKQRIEWINTELEKATEDMDRMSALLDELDLYQRRAQTVDLYSIDAKIDKMMPELGFTPEDNDRLVASYSGGWQMRMSLGKILLQDPDLLLLGKCRAKLGDCSFTYPFFLHFGDPTPVLVKLFVHVE